MKKFLILILSLGFLGACASDTPPSPRDMSFANLPKINLYVSDFQIVEEYKSPMQSPHVDHLFPVPPSRSVGMWAKDRLVAKGGPLLGRIIIRDASVKETELPIAKGWRGWFKTEESHRYDGTLSVMIEIVRPDGYVEAYVSAKSDRSRTVLEDASATEKDNVWHELAKDMIMDINAELEKQININFAPILMR